MICKLLYQFDRTDCFELMIRKNKNVLYTWDINNNAM